MSERDDTLDGFEAQLRAAFTEVLQHTPADGLLDALAGTAVAIIDDDACTRYAEQVADETRLKTADFRNGMAMELEPARDMVAAWVGAARGMLGDAENYSETPVEMEVKVGESPERFAFTLQRVGKLTPHQARQRVEARIAELEERLAVAEAERDRYAGVVASIPDGNDAALLARVRSELATARRKLYRIEEMAGAWQKTFPDSIRTAAVVEALRIVIGDQP